MSGIFSLASGAPTLPSLRSLKTLKCFGDGVGLYLKNDTLDRKRYKIFQLHLDRSLDIRRKLWKTCIKLYHGYNARLESPTCSACSAYFFLTRAGLKVFSCSSIIYMLNFYLNVIRQHLIQAGVSGFLTDICLLGSCLQESRSVLVLKGIVCIVLSC